MCIRDREKTGRALDQLDSIFGVYTSNLNTGPVPDIERAVVPKLTEFQDSVFQNAKLFQRIEKIYQSDAAKQLTTAQQRLVEDQYKTFVRRGAKLNDSDKAKMSQINSRLARLYTDFSQNVLEDEKGWITWIDDKADLDGLPESTIAAMANAAKERDKEGQWAVTNTRSSMDPFLTYAKNRSLRETVWRKYLSLIHI